MGLDWCFFVALAGIFFILLPGAMPWQRWFIATMNGGKGGYATLDQESGKLYKIELLKRDDPA